MRRSVSTWTRQHGVVRRGGAFGSVFVHLTQQMVHAHVALGSHKEEGLRRVEGHRLDTPLGL